MADSSMIAPVDLLAFRRAFDAGHFWESHEILEIPWRSAPNPLLHGLILHASAYVHLSRDNPQGALAQFGKAGREFSGLAPVVDGVPVGILRREIDELSGVIRDRMAAGDDTVSDLADGARLP